jgi:hypothetical protein
MKETLSVARNKSQEFNNEIKNKFPGNDFGSDSSCVYFQNNPKARMNIINRFNQFRNNFKITIFAP